MRRDRRNHTGVSLVSTSVKSALMRFGVYVVVQEQCTVIRFKRRSIVLPARQVSEGASESFCMMYIGKGLVTCEKTSRGSKERRWCSVARVSCVDGVICQWCATFGVSRS